MTAKSALDMHVAILDFGAGNVGSLGNMLARKCDCSSSVESAGSAGLAKATHWILPGVGHFGYAAEQIRSRGWDALIHSFVRDGGKLLGICLGAQLLMDFSEEGEAQGLGLIPGKVKRFQHADLSKGERIPHMGWSDVEVLHEPLREMMKPASRFYFVHAYHMNPLNQEDVLMKAGFAGGFTSAVRHGNVTGVQFHPEKSHHFGIEFLKAWLSGV